MTEEGALKEQKLLKCLHLLQAQILQINNHLQINLRSPISSVARTDRPQLTPPRPRELGRVHHQVEQSDASCL